MIFVPVSCRLARSGARSKGFDRWAAGDPARNPSQWSGRIRARGRKEVQEKAQVAVGNQVHATYRHEAVGKDLKEGEGFQDKMQDYGLQGAKGGQYHPAHMRLSGPAVLHGTLLARADARARACRQIQQAPAGRKRILDNAALKKLRMWLDLGPKRCGFESGSWHRDMIAEMIECRLNITCSPRTLRRVLRKIHFSYRRIRRVPHKSASAEAQKRFKEETSDRVARTRRRGHVIPYGDEWTSPL